ncbi:pyruvate dehydrogenase [Streptomyces atroolivaceus]
MQIDIQPERLGRRTQVDLGVWGDVGETLKCLTPAVQEKKSRRFLDRMLRKHVQSLEKAVGAYTRNVESFTPIHPEYVASVLDEVSADDAIFTVDTGMCCVWAARFITPNGRRRVLGSFVHGSMANALPQAIGAQFLDRGRQVVSLSGDGGFSMLMGDFLTLVQYDLPVKVVVFNNSSLGMVDLEMMVDGLPPHGTTYAHTNYAAIATAAGARGIRVESPADVRGSLREAFAHDGPALVDVVTDPDALAIPPRTTAEQVSGFALSAGRAVLTGGVGRMIHVARSNLRNVPRP